MQVALFVMEPVKTEFMLDKDQDQQAAGNPDGQSENIDQRVQGIAQQIPDGHFQIATKHRIKFSRYVTGSSLYSP